MSSSEYRVKLSTRAVRDTVQIFKYSIENWGARKAQEYRKDFDVAYDLLADNPLSGQLSPYLHRSARLYFVGSHVIVYRIDGLVITIVRILHQNMSLRKHL